MTVYSKKHRAIRGTAIVVSAMIASSSWGQAGQCQLDKLVAADGAAADQFGFSVSISGDAAVIGAHVDDDNGVDSGSAYIYRFNGSTWAQEQKLIAPDGGADDRFGVSVSISGDVAVIGAALDDDLGTDSGSAYIFRFDGSNWAQEQKLLASDGATADDFGRGVSISGDVAVIGAALDDDLGTDSGSAYVFRFNGLTWTQEQKLIASDGAATDWFGRSVSNSGDMALIGARLDDDLGVDSGSAYIFAGLGDCNGNGVMDCHDILNSTSSDVNGNLVPDECECPADLNNDGVVNVLDLLEVISNWGSDGSGGGDVNGDGVVNVLDLLAVISNWGQLCN